MKYVPRKLISTNAGMFWGRALIDFTEVCREYGEPLSIRQTELIAAVVLWAFHEAQMDADCQMLDIPAVRSAMPQRVREAILERDEFRCLACGATEDLEIDHVMPVALGGTNDPENLQVLCSTCNVRKRTDPVSYVAAGRGGKP